jgi:hypothetical protein
LIQICFLVSEKKMKMWNSHRVQFFSETTKQIWIKLARNVHWMVIYKMFVFGADRKSNMAAMTRLSLTLDPSEIPIGSTVKLSRVMVAILNFRLANDSQV